jgi:hypothetical protein
MKKKANGTFRARLNGRGFEQVPGIHYDPKSIAAPVVCMMTIRIVFILMLMAEWSGHVLDVRGAILKGNFADDETMYIHVPQGMEQWYGDDVVLRLRKTLYGLKQSAYRLWIYLLKVIETLKCNSPKRIHVCIINGLQLEHCFCGFPGSTIVSSQVQLQSCCD